MGLFRCDLIYVVNDVFPIEFYPFIHHTDLKLTGVKVKGSFDNSFR